MADRIQVLHEFHDDRAAARIVILPDGRARLDVETSTTSTSRPGRVLDWMLLEARRPGGGLPRIARGRIVLDDRGRGRALLTGLPRDLLRGPLYLTLDHGPPAGPRA
jgi:hypothetical protein